MTHRDTLGDTPEHAWMLEFSTRCFPESGERVNADLNLAMAMCKAEPKCAQAAMQLLAQEIRSERLGKPETVFFRFVLGVLFLAYVAVAHAEGRCASSDVPTELEMVLRWNPEIMACANEIGPIEEA